MMYDGERLKVGLQLGEIYWLDGSSSSTASNWKRVTHKRLSLLSMARKIAIRIEPFVAAFDGDE
ncbi:glycoprotease family protein [Anopheles sinensis]|uniref:Glycoprotease family protein n=1 Tax=Anopheles sinensis TaxID=74873 RepID=A0A084VIN2_ANOSI|nr:glycoprotease family protein [Anopheles sinensis]